jgi:ABC-type uncharacterized transport system substrate-binding protein
LLATLASTLAAPPAGAHPHGWIDLRTALLFDPEGRLTALRLHWAFDEFYSAFATEGFDRDGKGGPDHDRLMELAESNIASLKDYSYFTYVKVDGERAEYGEVRRYDSFMMNGRLMLVFTLPLARPVDLRATPVTYASYDPTYYIEVLHVETEAVLFEGPGAPQDCRAEIEAPKPDADIVGFAAALDQTESGGDGLGKHFAETVRLLCGEAE